MLFKIQKGGKMKKKKILAILLLGLYFLNSTAIYFNAYTLSTESPLIKKQNIELLSHLGGGLNDVEIAENHLYIATESGLQIFENLPNLSRNLSEVILPNPAKKVKVADKYAYVIENTSTIDLTSTINIIDVSSPAMPTVLGSFDTPGEANSVFVYGRYAYVADGSAGLQIFDVSDKSNPHLAGSYDTPGEAKDIYLNLPYKYAYVADGEGGLQVIDVNDVNNPSKVGSTDTSVTANKVFVSSTRAYICGPEGVQVFDSLYLTELGSYSTATTAKAFSFTSEELYLIEGDYTLTKLIISCLSTPQFDGSYTTFDDVRGIFLVCGTYAYAASSKHGLKVINVADPSDPTIVGSCDTPGEANGVFVKGDYAYVADGSSGLQVINVTNPSNPTIVGSCDTPGEANGVFVIGDYAYVADGNKGLQVIKMSGFSSLSIVANSETPKEAYAISIYNQLIALGGNEGFYLFRKIVTPPTTSLISYPPLPDGKNGWFITTPTIYLTSSLPSETFYSWDTTSSFNFYSAPFSAPQGVHTLYYYSVHYSSVSNETVTETIKNQTFKVDTIKPTVILHSPNGRENFIAGQKINVKWTADDQNFGTTPITIQISFDGGATYQDLATNLPNTGSAQISLPELSSKNCLIKIKAEDQAGNIATDVSDNYFEVSTYENFSSEVKADVNGDGKADSIVLYDEGFKTASLWVFISSGGSFQPKRFWLSEIGKFDPKRAKLSAGDVNKDGRADAIVLYDKGSSTSALYAFISSGSSFTKKTFWVSSPGGFSFSRAKLSAGDVNKDGRADAIVLYDYGNETSGMWVFISQGSSFSPKLFWKSLAGSWNYYLSQLAP